LAAGVTGYPVAMTTTTPKVMAVQAAAAAVGAVLLTVGVLGFVPGVTAGYDTFAWAGHHSGARLFGIFAVSGAANLIHLGLGLAGLVLSRTYAAARAYLLAGGAGFLALWGYGLTVAAEDPRNVLALNAADNWLHLAAGGLMVLFGLTLGARRDPTRRPRRRPHGPRPRRHEPRRQPGRGVPA